MSKYDKLWECIENDKREKIVLSFEDAERILGFPIDHSFLSARKELLDHGYRSDSISMKNRTLGFSRMKERAVIYIHGKGGNASQSRNYAHLFPDSDVIGIEYSASTPWDAESEFPRLFDKASRGYSSVDLIAVSIGAFLAVNSLGKKRIRKAFLISPVLDMEGLIMHMMETDGITESELREKGEIASSYGETLSWKYLCYVREKEREWGIPTTIIRGDGDLMAPEDGIMAFASKHSASVITIHSGHYIHTKEELEAMDDAIRSSLQ